MAGRLPERRARREFANAQQLLGRHADHRAAQVRGKREILPAVGEERQRAAQVADFDRIEQRLARPGLTGDAALAEHARHERRVSRRRAQQDGHVAQLDWAQRGLAAGAALRDLRACGKQLLDLFGGERGLALDALGFERIVVALVVRRGRVALRRVRDDAKLDARGGVERRVCKLLAPGAEPLGLAEFRAAQRRLDQAGEHFVEARDEGRVASEIVRQVADRPAGAALVRGDEVGDEAWLGLAEAVDALLYVADEEAVAAGFAVPRDEADQLELHRAGVLHFVDEDVAIAAPEPLGGRRRHETGAARAAEDVERCALDVAKFPRAATGFRVVQGSLEPLLDVEQHAHERRGRRGAVDQAADDFAAPALGEAPFQPAFAHLVEQRAVRLALRLFQREGREGLDRQRQCGGRGQSVAPLAQRDQIGPQRLRVVVVNCEQRLQLLGLRGAFVAQRRRENGRGAGAQRAFVRRVRRADVAAPGCGVDDVLAKAIEPFDQ